MDSKKCTLCAVFVVLCILVFLLSVQIDIHLTNPLSEQPTSGNVDLHSTKQKYIETETIICKQSNHINIEHLNSLHQIVKNTYIGSRTELWKVVKALGISENGQAAEIGTWTGDSAYGSLNNWGGTLYMIDPYSHLNDWNMLFNKKQAEMDKIFSIAQKRMEKFGKRAIFLRERGKDAHSKFDDASLDWIFIDGDHTLKGIFADLWNYWSKVKSGGLVCGHDYRNAKSTGGYEDGKVKDIVDALSYTTGSQIFLKTDFVWCTIKQ